MLPAHQHPIVVGCPCLPPQEEGEALPFAPRQTASVALALELARGLPPDALLYGAHTPTPGTTQKWGVYVSLAVAVLLRAAPGGGGSWWEGSCTHCRHARIHHWHAPHFSSALTI